MTYSHARPPPMEFPDLEEASLLVGIPQIDAEHAELMAEIGRLLGPPALGLDSERFSEIISRLGLQLSEHFEHEEAIIAACGLPAGEAAAHARAHRKILEQYTDLQLGLMSHSSMDQAEVLAMIQAWIVGHLTAFDLRLQAYAPFAGGGDGLPQR